MGAPARIVFMGTPDFAVPSLRALAGDPRCVVTLVVSQPDRGAGRGQKVVPTPVKACAVDLGIPVYQPESLNDDDAYDRLGREHADLFVVAAFGQILRQRVLDLPTLGCVNVHASLLPRWRGAAPIQRAVQAGDGVTGVCIMRMERGLDTGPVYARRETPIGPSETAGELHDRLADLGAALLVDTLDAVRDPAFEPEPQPDEGATYATRLGPEDRSVDFGAPAAAVAAHINGMSPWPGVSVMCGDTGMTLLRARPMTDPACDGPPGTVVCADPDAGLRIACGDGAVEILEVKRPGKRAMPIADCLRGVTLPVGAPLRVP